jgi:hypothetical protein
MFLKYLHWLSFIWTLWVFYFRIFKWHPPWKIISVTFDIGFDLGLRGFIGGWTFGNERLKYLILETNNHVHLIIKKKKLDLYGVFSCQKWTIHPSEQGA